jgi:hypothetical protein
MLFAIIFTLLLLFCNHITKCFIEEMEILVEDIGEGLFLFIAIFSLFFLFIF